MSKRAKVIAIALAAAVALVAAGAIAIPRMAHRQITVTAHFEDAVGLYVGNGVSVLGMPVGKVTSVVAKDSYVEVKLAIDDGVDIPADVQAVTVSNSILTDRVVELTPPYHGGAKLKNGDVLGLGRTRTPVEFDRTLAMMDKLGKALHGDPNGHGPLGDLVNLGAQITSANGPGIKATLDKLSQALRVGTDNGARSKKNIQAIITSVAELTQAAADNDAAIRQFGSNLRQLSDILADEDLGSGSTGAKLNQILAEAARLLERNREGLKGTFAGTRAITTSLTDNRRELAGDPRCGADGRRQHLQHHRPRRRQPSGAPAGRQDHLGQSVRQGNLQPHGPQTVGVRNGNAEGLWAGFRSDRNARPDGQWDQWSTMRASPIRHGLRGALAAGMIALLTGCAAGLDRLPLPAPEAGGQSYALTAVFSDALNLPAKAKVKLLRRRYRRSRLNPCAKLHRAGEYADPRRCPPARRCHRRTALGHTARRCIRCDQARSAPGFRCAPAARR